jgi:hypothetical protein
MESQNCSRHDLETGPERERRKKKKREEKCAASEATFGRFQESKVRVTKK